MASEWTSAEHVESCRARADEFPHRLEGEGVLLDHDPGGRFPPSGASTPWSPRF